MKATLERNVVVTGTVRSQVPCSQFVASVLIKLARELDLISRYRTTNKANISITAYSISYLVLIRHFTINKCLILQTVQSTVQKGFVLLYFLYIFK